MNAFELDQLKYFDEKETYFGSHDLIDWRPFNARTMFAVDRLRALVNAPVYILRGPHPNRPEAVDAVCPERSLDEVYMQLCRLQLVSWGVYSGNSFHIDARTFDEVPARWFAVHSDESYAIRKIQAVAYSAPIPGENRKWDYFAWDHPRAFESLAVCLSIARRKAGEGNV